MTEESNLHVGTKVRLESTGEVGVVIHTWHNAELGDLDCYVAFFGMSYPSGEPKQLPYVLRYLASSLRAVD